MREMLDLEDSSTAGETVLGHHPHNMAAHSPFTGCPQENAFDGLAPLHVSSGSVPKFRYDIFINLRGTDVKDPFAEAIDDHLASIVVKRLLAFELEAKSCFRDEYIDIFAENYPLSNWALAELILMLKTPTAIIPVSIIVVIVFRWVAEGKGRYMNAFVYRVLRKSRGVHQLFRNSLMNGYEVQNKDLRRLQ